MDNVKTFCELLDPTNVDHMQALLIFEYMLQRRIV